MSSCQGIKGYNNHMGHFRMKDTVLFILIVAVSCLLAYVIDQYYIAGRGYTFFFDILKI